MPNKPILNYHFQNQLWNYVTEFLFFFIFDFLPLLPVDRQTGRSQGFELDGPKKLKGDGHVSD